MTAGLALHGSGVFIALGFFWCVSRFQFREFRGFSNQVHLLPPFPKEKARQDFKKSEKSFGGPFRRAEHGRPSANPNGIPSFSPGLRGRTELPWVNVQNESSTLKGLNPIHRKVSFQDEFRQLLQRYETEFDERYVWD
jgi:hypothetical protein